MKLPLALLVISSSGLLAQTVSVASVTSPQSVTTFVLADAVLQTDFLPPGAMSPDQGVSSFALSTSGTAGGWMAAQWSVQPPASSELLVIEYTMSGSLEALPGQVIGGVEIHDLVFSLVAPAPRAVDLQAVIERSLPTGTSAAVLEVDVYDDGAIEWDGATTAGTVNVLIGPQPVPVRVRGGVTMQTNGGELDLEMSLRLEVRADNDVQVTAVDAGCQPRLWCEPAFDHEGVRLRVPYGQLALAVFGLGAQPVTLPPVGATSCLLLPTPELAVPVDHLGLDVLLPVSVRP